MSTTKSATQWNLENVHRFYKKLQLFIVKFQPFFIFKIFVFFSCEDTRIHELMFCRKKCIVRIAVKTGEKTILQRKAPASFSDAVRIS